MNAVADATDVLVIAGFIGATAFVVRYLRTRWFASSVGRHEMAFMFALALILSLAAATTIWGEFWNRSVLRLITYVLINAIIWWRLFLLFEGQRVVRRRKRDKR